MHEFVFVITARKGLSFAKMCLESIQAQLGSFYYSTIYVDDASNYTQKEHSDLAALVQQANGRVLTLQQRHYQIGSLSEAIPLVKNKNAIVCLVDGDDYLLPHALQTVAKAYENKNVAMSYGNVLLDFRPYQDCQPHYFYDKKSVNTEYPQKVWETRTFREDGFRCFHLRTFRRWLWDYIDPKDFKRPDGGFIRASGDSAFVYPMLELLANSQHVTFIDTPLYVYRLHDGNVHNHDKKSQSDDLDLLRFKMKKYDPIDRDLLNYHLQEAPCAE